MTPQEKAKDLYDSYWYCLLQSNIEKRNYWSQQCALIAVDEIIKVCPYIRQKDWETLQQLNAPNIYFVEYWNEVKQEIEKL
jgi:hypothetical protein